ncbi:MAG: hypothetical protein KBS66_00730 [Eubacterium sp.]|nr:hypothetical protein [Candidatus Colimonas fimequi]
MKEDKQKICDALLEAFKLTRERDNIVSIEYDVQTEMVCVLYASGFKMLINVAMDSGMAMISDIMKQIKY